MKQILNRLGSQLSRRERVILMLTGLVLLAFALSAMLPAITAAYRERQGNIESVRLDIAREQRLLDDAERWQQRRQEVETRRQQLQGQLFSGSTVPLVEAAIQRDLTQHARNSDIEVLSTRLAQREEAPGWLMVSQEMSFRTSDAANSVRFLEALEQSSPRLFVRDFSLDRSRNQYSGAITVVGFARSDVLSPGAVANLRQEGPR